MDLKSKLKTIEVEPKLYLIVLCSVNNPRNLAPATFVHWGVYYTLDDAKTNAFNKMNETIGNKPETRGLNWASVAEIVILPEQIEQMFTANLVNVENITNLQKNRLMKKIIDSKSPALLEKNKEKFSDAELQYLNNRLNEGHQ